MEKALNILNNLPPTKILNAFYTVLSSPVELKETKFEEYEQEEFVTTKSFSPLIKVNLG